MALLPVTAAIAARSKTLELSAAEATRFSRHILLPEVGVEGQRRLKAARVLLIGTGGLGSPASLYLAAAGVGTLGLVEFDTVDASNLQRQILYTEADTGRPKIEAARARLQALSPMTRIILHSMRLDDSNANAIFNDYDVIIDGTDNFPTRYLANDACVFLRKPYIYGSIYRFEGHASVFYAPHGPCYRCLFPTPPPPGQAPSCAEGGVLGVLPGQIGVMQATEAIKLIIGAGEPLIGRLLTLDALTMRFDEFKIRRDPACPVCGEQPTIKTLAMSVASCATTPDNQLRAGDEISVDELHTLRVSRKPHVLIDVRTPSEVAVCRIEGSLLMPLGELGTHLNELDREAHIIIHCKAGPRSAKALRLLQDAGFKRAQSLTGGILAWIDAYAPDLPKY